MRILTMIATLCVALLTTDGIQAYQSGSTVVDLVTIDVRDKDLKEVLAQIGTQVGVNIVPVPSIGVRGWTFLPERQIV